MDLLGHVVGNLRGCWFVQGEELGDRLQQVVDQGIASWAGGGAST